MPGAVKVIWICGALLLCGFNASVRPMTIDGRRCVVLSDAARASGWDLAVAPDGRSVTVSGARFSVRLVRDSGAALFEGVHLALAGKVLCRPDGTWLIGEDDLLHILKPLLIPMPLPPTPVRRVVIDAGHGGGDPGAVSGGVQEKTVNLKLAELLASRLKERGFDVVLTRSADRFVPLDDRADRVRLENGDIFLSIHQNSARNPLAAGTEIFFAPGTRYAAASMHLALAVQFCVLTKTGAFGTRLDRGVKRAGFRVLRKADCPAVLLECGFLSNEMDRAKLTRAEYLEQLAEAVALGVEGYRSLLKPLLPKKELQKENPEGGNAL